MTISLIVLVIMIIITASDIDGVPSSTSDNDIEVGIAEDGKSNLTSDIPFWAFGVVTLFFEILVFSLLGIYRSNICEIKNISTFGLWKDRFPWLTSKWIFTFIFGITFLICGIFIFAVTEHESGMTLGFLLPIILISGNYSFVSWIDNDYSIITDITEYNSRIDKS